MNSENMVKANKINCFFAVILLFLMLDTFSIFPDSVVVPIPGLLRMSDLFFFVFAGALFFKLNRILQIIQTHKTMTLIVLGSLFLFFMTALMAYMFFHQSFLSGLLAIRKSFDYLLIFPLLVMIRSKEDLKFFIKLLVLFVFCIALLAYAQKVFPSLPIFNYKGIGESHSDPNSLRYSRMGMQRIFFPHVSLAVLCYFLTLTNVFRSRSFKEKIPQIMFLVMVLYTIYLTGTRVHIFTMLFVTAFGLITSKRQELIITGFVFLILALAIQFFSIAVSQKGVSAIEDSGVAKLFISMGDTDSGSLEGRFFQNQMYMKQFLRSPLTGVGTLKFSPNIQLTYKQYGFYSNNDLGYSKILGEYGMIGILWIIWVYIYVFKKTGRILKTQFTFKKITDIGSMAKGVQLFFLYVLVSGLTIPHFVEGKRIIPLVLGFLVLEVSGLVFKQNQSAANSNGLVPIQ